MVERLIENGNSPRLEVTLWYRDRMKMEIRRDVALNRFTK
jgi:hypothetical protein